MGFQKSSLFFLSAIFVFFPFSGEAKPQAVLHADRASSSLVYEMPVAKGGGWVEAKIQLENAKYNLTIQLLEKKNQKTEIILKSEILDVVDIKGGPHRSLLELYPEVVDGQVTGAFFLTLSREDSDVADKMKLKYSLKKDRSQWELVWLSRAFLNQNGEEVKSCVVNFIGNNFIQFLPRLNQMSLPHQIEPSEKEALGLTFSAVKKLEEKGFCANTVTSPMQKPGIVDLQINSSSRIKMLLDGIDRSSEIQSPL